MDYKLKEDHEFSFNNNNNNNNNNNMLTRSGSSVGCSSRIYYHRKPEGIPFQWEKQPGTSKHPPIADSILPPLSPPPAVLSLRLPNPCLEQPKPQNSWPRFILSFWRRRRKGNRLLVNKESSNKRVNPNNTIVHDHDHDQFFSFDSSEFMAKFSPSCDNSRSSSASSSSLSLSINNNNNTDNNISGRDSFERSLGGCSPWNVNSIVVAISRRIT